MVKVVKITRLVIEVNVVKVTGLVAVVNLVKVAGFVFRELRTSTRVPYSDTKLSGVTTCTKALPECSSFTTESFVSGYELLILILTQQH